jgi:hypothetical protein
MVVLPIILAHMVATGKDQRLQKTFLWPHRSFSVAREVAHSRTSPLPYGQKTRTQANSLLNNPFSDESTSRNTAVFDGSGRRKAFFNRLLTG